MRKSVFLVIVMAVFLSGCEADGDFVYVCDEDGRCTGEAHWWVEGSD